MSLAQNIATIVTSDGSSLFFWRWPAEYKKDVRDGLEVCVEGQLPEYWARQDWPKDLAEREQLKKKL